MGKIKIVCSECGSDDIRKDAWAMWSVDAQEWELSATFEQPNWCEDCGTECSIEEVKIP